MTPQEIQELETLEDLFIHPGWKLLTQDLEHIRENLKETAHISCKTNDEWQERRGQLKELDFFLGYEQDMKSRLENYRELPEDQDAFI